MKGAPVWKGGSTFPVRCSVVVVSPSPCGPPPLRKPKSCSVPFVSGERGGKLRSQLVALHPDSSKEKIEEAIQAACDRFVDKAEGISAPGQVKVERVLSDNGACYRSRVHAHACAELEMRHIFTRPYRPQTNGKASASSRRSPTAGPTEPSMAPRPSEPRRCPAGSTTTTSGEGTAPLATGACGSAYRAGTTW